MGRGGQSPRYQTKEEMQIKIDKYFRDCKGEMLRDDKGNIIFDKFGRPIMVGQKPLTVTGLALALGFTSRQALLNYQGKKEFVDTITRAKSRIEQYAEERLFDKEGTSGAQFSLRNNFRGWDADKKENMKDSGGVVIVNNIPRK